VIEVPDCAPSPVRLRLPLIELTARYKPAHGDLPWTELVDYFRNYPDEWETVTTLAAVLERGERFREPIRLDAADLRVANGMHRIAASLLTSATDIDVTFEDPVSVPEDYVIVELRAWLNNAMVEDYEDTFDFVTSHLRSFPIGDHWAETDDISCVSGVVRAKWWCRGVTPDELVAALIQRARLRDVPLTILSAETATPAEFEYWFGDDNDDDERTIS